jgi:hypothetical protein
MQLWQQLAGAWSCKARYASSVLLDNVDMQDVHAMMASQGLRLAAKSFSVCALQQLCCIESCCCAQHMGHSNARLAALRVLVVQDCWHAAATAACRLLVVCR